MPTTRIFVGQSFSQPQSDSIKLSGTYTGAETITVTVGPQGVSVVAGSTSIPTVASTLAAALGASTVPFFKELTYSADTAGVTMIGTSAAPYTLTSVGISGGTGAVATVSLQSAINTNDWNLSSNWSGGSLPAAGDTVVFDTNSPSLLYGLNHATLALGPIFATERFTNSIGLPDQNSAGYPEYRDTALRVSSPLITIGGPSGGGSPMIRLNSGSTSTSLQVYSTGNSPDGLEAVRWVGTHASNTVNVLGGKVAIAAGYAEAATVATLTVAAGAASNTPPAARCGPGLTLTTATVTAGAVELNGGLSTLTVDGDASVRLRGNGVSVALVHAYGGETSYESNGAVTAAVIDGGKLLFTSDTRSRTVGGVTMGYGGELDDRLGTIAWSGASITLNEGADWPDVTLRLGAGSAVVPA